MESFTEGIQKKYIEDITTKLPIYRVLILLIFLLGAYTYNSEEGFRSRILQYLQNLKVDFIYDLDTGLFSKTPLLHFIICLFLVVLNQALYTKLKDLAFKKLVKIAGKQRFDTFTTKIHDDISLNKSNNEAVNFYISKDLSNQLDIHRKKLKGYHCLGEILLAAIGVLLVGFIGLTTVDWIVITCSLLSVLWMQWLAFKYYIAWFIPFYVAERSLLNANFKFGEQ